LKTNSLVNEIIALFNGQFEKNNSLVMGLVPYLIGDLKKLTL
jgi:hypothetical protein